VIAFRALTQAAQAAAPSVTVTVPPGLIAGDRLLCALNVGGGSGVTITAPSGWTPVLGTNDGTAARLAIFHARYREGMAASHTFTLSAAQPCVAQVAAYGGADHAAPIDVSGAQANASSTSATAPSVVTTKSHAHLVAFWAAATGAPEASPPAGMAGRAEIQGDALALSVADAVQAFVGATGTKVATLSGASTNIGALLALAPAALNTPGQVRDEGGWRYEAFAPRIAGDAAFDAFVEGVIQRVNRDLFRRLGASVYTEGVLADPWNALLQRAEMHLVQAELLAIAASLAGTADDETTRPYLGTPAEIRSQALDRRRQAREIIALCRTSARPGPGAPIFTAGLGATAIRPLFDDERGLVE
jgi:hypothetical protein